MEIRIHASTVDELSTKTKYDTKKGRLSTVIQAEVGLRAEDIARLHNLIAQGIPLFMVIGSHQGKFDFALKPRGEDKQEASAEKTPEERGLEPTGTTAVSEAPTPSETTDVQPDPAPWLAGEQLYEVVMLAEDAELHAGEGIEKPFLSLRYNGTQLAPFEDICPPVKQLKSGTMLKLITTEPNGAIQKVTLANEAEIGSQHIKDKQDRKAEAEAAAARKIGEERDRIARETAEKAEAEAAHATATKPKPEGKRKMKRQVGV